MSTKPGVQAPPLPPARVITVSPPHYGRPARGRRTTPVRAVGALFIATFAVNTAENIVGGLLPAISADLRVDIPTAGQLITGYALGVAIAGPALALLTTGMSRRILLLAVMGIFILGNVGWAMSTSYAMLLAARLDFVFTAEGRMALEAAHGMQGLAVSVAGAIRAAKTAVEGLVRISCVPGLAGPLLAFQAAVEARYPKLHVEVSADFERADLAKGETDIALRVAEPQEPDLIANQCFEIGLTVFAAKSYVARHGLPATEDELCNHKLILYTRRFAELSAFNWLERYAAANAHTMRADGPDMMLGLVSAGGGIGIIDFHGDAAPDLVRVFAQPSTFVRGWLVYHESSRNTARVKAVVEMLVAFLKARLCSAAGDNEQRDPT